MVECIPENESVANSMSEIPRNRSYCGSVKNAERGKRSAVLVEDVPLQCEPEIQGPPWALLALMAGETRDAVQATLEAVNADAPFASLEFPMLLDDSTVHKIVSETVARAEDA